MLSATSSYYYQYMNKSLGTEGHVKEYQNSKESVKCCIELMDVHFKFYANGMA